MLEESSGTVGSTQEGTQPSPGGTPTSEPSVDRLDGLSGLGEEKKGRKACPAPVKGRNLTEYHHSTKCELFTTTTKRQVTHEAGELTMCSSSQP